MLEKQKPYPINQYLLVYRAGLLDACSDGAIP